jgi:hypothetical protein
MNNSALMCTLLLLTSTACAGESVAAGAPTVAVASEPQAAAPSTPSPRTGYLVVYSATYPSTLEQSEYPTHTDYTVATPDDNVIEHVKNARGTFNSRPAKVSLRAGEYHVRAQNNRGRFVTVQVAIEPGKTTVIDLETQGR